MKYSIHLNWIKIFRDSLIAIRDRHIIFVGLSVLSVLSACQEHESLEEIKQKQSIDQLMPFHRGPTILSLDGDANGLWWDDREHILYVADDNNNRILRWTDADGFALLANLPSDSTQRSGFGQLVKMQDGTIVVTRFGAGEIGDVAYITPNANVKVVENLNVERRIGLCVSENGIFTILGMYVYLQEQG